MSDKNFDANKTVQQALNAIIHVRSAEEAKTGLTAASILEPDARAYIADKLEKTILIEMVKSPESIKFFKELAAAVKQTRETNPSQLPDLQDSLESFDATNRLIQFVFENKGDAAGVLVKSYVEEAGKLSDEEYALPENLMNTLCKAAEKAMGITPDAPKTNPFRQNPPGM